MIATDDAEMTGVLAKVASWTVTERIRLARKILETTEEGSLSSCRGYSAEEVIALLQMPQPAAGDAECRQIIEEELQRKHGT